MTIIFKSVALPDDFSRLLRSNMQIGGKMESELPRVFNQSEHLKYLVKTTFNLDTPRIDLWSMIKTIGWLGLRNRLASVYLYYLEHGIYPKEYDLSYIKEIEEFENKTRSYQVEGHSRIFLLGMFLKAQEFVTDSLWFSAFNDKKLLACLDLSSAKSVKSDWLLLMLYHFKLFLGTEDLVDKLQKADSFDNIYQALDDDEKRVYLGNMLAYGHSIGDLTSFFNLTV